MLTTMLRTAAPPAAKRRPSDLFDDQILLKELESHLAWHFGKAARRSVPENGEPEIYDLQAARFRQLVADVEERLAASLATRRMARAMPVLRSRLNSISSVCPKPLNRVILLLEVADDLVVRLVHPQTGWRGDFHLEAVEGNRHFLEEAMPILAGTLGQHLSYNPFLSLHEDSEDGPALFHSPFALYSNPDICLVLDASTRMDARFWLWGNASPREFPVVDGVRTAYLGEPPFPQEWPRERLFPELCARVELLV